MGAARSASRTIGVLASASEYTATVRIPRRRAVRMMRQAISPRLAIRRDVSTSSHPEHAEARTCGYRRVEGRRECQAQDVSGLRGIDHTVVPEPGRGEIGVAFVLVLAPDRGLEGLSFLRGPFIRITM